MPRRLGPTILSALVALVLTACGSSGGDSSSNGIASKSPDQIVAAATSAVSSVNSVHVSGAVLSGGQHVTLDLNLVNGKGGKGSMAQNGLGFQIVAVGPEVYINGSQSFWKTFGGSAAAQLLSGKWLKAPATGQLSSLATLTNVQKLFNQLLSSHGKLAKGKTTTIHGQQAIAVTDTTNGGTLYVATTGKAYPLEISKTGAEGGQITFDHFNQPVSLAAPPHAIDISQLK
ncbi:MAG TPA: hypothetical protein VMB27_17410 [Solirubrobacteraceae bacterium]|nr:hypothetical protein [Solirubrobacteraceae bacterium]